MLKALSQMNDIQRWQIAIQGQVQGVGFRPMIYRYAKENLLGGWIANTAEGLLVEIEGKKRNINSFMKKLETSSPTLANITSLEKVKIKPVYEKEFIIKPSFIKDIKLTLIPPDISICEDCLAELFDKHNRRHLYPFINCVNCGPRFTIVKDIPYDRINTTMEKFTMCPACKKEYDNPLNRRFHAQPNACPDCGPEIQLISNEKSKITTGKDAIEKTVELLADGKIVAVKGLGGFHLACDASSDNAVGNLRQRKYREDKPFALMAKDLDTIRHYCEVSPEEEELLLSLQRPIVLLRRHLPPSTFHVPQISEHVAPNNKFLGFMLPYTPIHHVIFNLKPATAPTVLVMTSGNISDEPICYRNEEAFTRLKDIADYYLVNNRDIHIRCDDSVNKSGIIIRRSRGYAPSPLNFDFKFRYQVLGCGAELKNTFCLTKNEFAFISHHIGDLENAETLAAFENGIKHFKRLFDINPEIIAYDMHPEYLSTKYALNLPEDSYRLLPVQHHHAHIASCMAENNILDEKVIGVAFDGLGYGDDETFWGGEFLVCDFKNYRRAAHLAYLPLPGSSMAIKEPWRMACVYLHHTFGDNFTSLDIEFTKMLNKNSWKIVKDMICKKVNSPLTSSTGRLFDAVSAMLNIRHEINYEGEAAIELEQTADSSPEIKDSGYEFDISKQETIEIDAKPLIRAIVSDIQEKIVKEKISAKFHYAVAGMILNVCKLMKRETGLKKVVLSGGVFQNMILLQGSYALLTKAGFEVYFHSKVPTNDGGISLGQAVVANYSD